MVNTFYALLIISAFPFQGEVTEWDKVSESDGVLTKIGTDQKTGFPIFESVVTINTDKESVHKQLTDYDNLKNIVYAVSESKKIADKEDGVVVFYQFDLPWPVSDKYAITKEYSEFSESQINIYVKSTSSDYRPSRDLSKIDLVTTNWILDELDDETTRVTYRSTADPMGIPNWVVKLFLSTSPRETLKRLREESEAND